MNLKPDFEIRGSKVLLRPFGLEDVTDGYIAWLNDPVVVRYSNQRFQTHDRESCVRYLNSFSGTDNIFVSVHRLDTNKAIGTMTAYVSRRHGTVDVGILIGDKSVWGGGYGQDAWNTFTNWLLAQGSIRKLTGGTLACNAAMIRIMERSGMQLEAVRKSQEIVEGVPQDIIYFAKFDK
jgi:[ribosomal protein S5]-alanine N-acetyltransferase